MEAAPASNPLQYRIESAIDNNLADISYETASFGEITEKNRIVAGYIGDIESRLIENLKDGYQVFTLLMAESRSLIHQYNYWPAKNKLEYYIKGTIAVSSDDTVAKAWKKIGDAYQAQKDEKELGLHEANPEDWENFANYLEKFRRPGLKQPGRMGMPRGH